RALLDLARRGGEAAVPRSIPPALRAVPRRPGPARWRPGGENDAAVPHGAVRADRRSELPGRPRAARSRGADRRAYPILGAPRGDRPAAGGGPAPPAAPFRGGADRPSDPRAARAADAVPRVPQARRRPRDAADPARAMPGFASGVRARGALFHEVATDSANAPDGGGSCGRSQDPERSLRRRKNRAICAARARMACRSPGSRMWRDSTRPSNATPIQMVPTGFASLPPVGPAMP